MSHLIFASNSQNNLMISNVSDETATAIRYAENANIPEDAIFFPHPEEMLIPWIINPYFFPIIVTYILTFAIGVSGNLVVILFMAGDKTNRSATSIFLVSLAISDLLLLTIYAPLEVANYFVIQWDKEGTVCKLATFAESVSAFASVLNLVAVTFERFVVIVFPIHSRSLCTMNNCKRLMVIVWVFSFFMAIPVIKCV
ncbi:gastrin-releasing peptide receptor-like protein [Leptotrombidium deliense]|uniref:Gastrin-releasing peptide receptor-like protein n=1 Tax=Leptotrombidium deliense TaxID=299467 RepID=A0A443SPS9_9ACAR|nr:gastrin-releasing peptide receptor-like protein [Leptotrombidium deliense]